MPIRRGWLLLILLGLFCPFSLFAQTQDEEDDDFPPGVLARYSSGGKMIQRVDPDISFVWGTAAPDRRIPPGPFEVQWNSLLLNRENNAYRFHVFLDGAVSLTVDGKIILDGKTDRPGWVSSQAVQLGFGEKSLSVTFRKTNTSARIQLFWSSKNFRLEPLPSHLLFRETGNAELNSIQRGRVLFDSRRCNRCHRRDTDSLSLPAPDLTHVAAGMNSEQLLNQIRNDGTASPHVQMPSFGFSTEEAKAVAAFLADSSKPVSLQKLPKGRSKEPTKEPREGEILFRSAGCLACHTVGKYGKNEHYGGGDLSGIGRKRSTDWLNTWLADPGKLNSDHRMPVFKLSSAERRRLVLYLSSLRANGKQSGRGAADSRSKGNVQLVQKGRQLVAAARCAACHRIPGLKADFSGISDLSKPVKDWSRSCLVEQADRRKNRPAYRNVDQDAVMAFVGSQAGNLSPLGEFAKGQLILDRRNCLACHERGQSKGNVAIAGQMDRIDESLKGQSQGLIPPALTAVGDKLLDQVLAEAVSGEQKAVRLPWLRVLMPKFQHSKGDKAALLAYLIGHDRIPDGAPQTPVTVASNKADTAQTLVVGRTLIGAGGFSCIACHDIGEFKPRNVALGTRGSDLLMLGKRMRKSYYERWTAAPMRTVPGMEMPSLKKAVPGVLGDDINRQLTATWEALNDIRFKAPTDPASVEQFFTIQPGAPARIVRDVFTNPKENGGGYVPRAMAIGLNNGHNLLFDLDTFSLRGWSFGDFARQRTQGKSWYWDMAGIPVMTGFSTTLDFALQNRTFPVNPLEEKLIFPHPQNGSNGRLISYKPYQDGVRFSYEIPFEFEKKVHKIRFYETILPTSNSVEKDFVIKKRPAHFIGWERRIDVLWIPRGYDLLISWPESKEGIGSPSIDYRRRAGLNVVYRPDKGPWKARKFTSFYSEGPGKRSITMRYLSSLKQEKSQIDLKPKEEELKVEPVTTLPGYDGVRLPISRSIMPTAFTWTHDGKLAFTSLKGHVYIAHDTDGDGVEDKLEVFEEGLAAPYGIIADGKDLIVAHKPELLRLRDTDSDGRADVREVFATGWGFNDNYHDWTCGIVRDAKGNFYVGLGSDYAQKNRPKENSRWRGNVLKISPKGEVTSIATSFRYPTGLALNAAGDLFVTDNQGVQNTFNEINHIIPGRHYGVPGRHHPNPDVKAFPPAIQVPHPWTRSVNALIFLPDKPEFAPFGNHGIGCEYNGRLLIRFTLQQVGDVMQGATYFFSRPNGPLGEENFVGPLCIAVSPQNEIVIGSIFDSGWLGGRNTGAITKLKPNGNFPNGIRELTATSDGFEIEFIHKIDHRAAADPKNYTLSGYTRVWQGSYATPDSGRYKVNVKSIDVSADGKTVRLHVERLKQGYVYEVTCGRIGTDAKVDLFPATGHYTLHRIPK
jgi:mono/diheme cytochrome c family protein